MAHAPVALTEDRRASKELAARIAKRLATKLRVTWGAQRVVLSLKVNRRPNQPRPTMFDKVLFGNDRALMSASAPFQTPLPGHSHRA
jgi:hypothetical protein